MIPDYFFVLFGIIVTSLLIDKCWRLKIFQSRNLFYGFIIPFVSIVIWENYAEWRGHWIMNPDYLIGIYLNYVPLENFVYGLSLVSFSVVLWNYFNRRKTS